MPVHGLKQIHWLPARRRVKSLSPRHRRRPGDGLEGCFEMKVDEGDASTIGDLHLQSTPGLLAD